ncbi:hypothetical protein TNCV_2846821 [Trichonephila clavipes]|nr:hypothetical protein TNCV_2846821 [Trichonephila clavipes]
MGIGGHKALEGGKAVSLKGKIQVNEKRSILSTENIYAGSCEIQACLVDKPPIHEPSVQSFIDEVAVFRSKSTTYERLCYFLSSGGQSCKGPGVGQRVSGSGITVFHRSTGEARQVSICWHPADPMVDSASELIHGVSSHVFVRRG